MASSSGAVYGTHQSQAAFGLSSTCNHDNPIVFVNHHRPDIGKFVDRLSQTLISHRTMAASLHIAISIFSKNYAKSSGCLNDLLFMLKWGIPIIPIFYGVKPSDLDSNEYGGMYDKDLCVLEKDKTFDVDTCQVRPRYDPKTIRGWRQALSNASEICGFELTAYNGDEERLVRDVVKCVWTMVRGHKSASYSYDVFLNHRGPDTKKTLASNLYYRLRHRGVRVFLDEEEIQKGSRIDSVIKNVIKDTLVHVAIFSAGYAKSEYCMKESGSTIIPVYYNVNYTDMWSNTVNKRNGVYDESLRILKDQKISDRETHEDKERYQSSSIEQWKKALMEVTGREGFKLETYDGDEVTRLVDMIVEEVDKSKVVRKMLAAANGNAI